MEIIRKAERVHVNEYQHSFRSIENQECGYGFPCDSEGNIDFESMPEAAIENIAYCFSEDAAGHYVYRGIDDISYSYWQCAVGKCEVCGAEIHLDDPMDNFCDCGAIYNSSGQKVKCAARDIDYLDAGEIWDED
jgi:hypothetical protein